MRIRLSCVGEPHPALVVGVLCIGYNVQRVLAHRAGVDSAWRDIIRVSQRHRRNRLIRAFNAVAESPRPVVAETGVTHGVVHAGSACVVKDGKKFPCYLCAIT